MQSRNFKIHIKNDEFLFFFTEKYKNNSKSLIFLEQKLKFFLIKYSLHTYLIHRYINILLSIINYNIKEVYIKLESYNRNFIIKIQHGSFLL